MDAPQQPATRPELLRHSRFDDAQAIFSGTLFVAIAMMLFGQAGLLTGGTAGVAFLLHYATGVSFGKVFFLVNLPFYWFAWRHMGRTFTVKTFGFTTWSKTIEGSHVPTTVTVPKPYVFLPGTLTVSATVTTPQDEVGKTLSFSKSWFVWR